MADSALSISYATVAAFTECTEGNYRNAVYVFCDCPGSSGMPCRDFLFIPGGTCQPVIFPIRDAVLFFGRQIDSSECVGTMTSTCFIRMYRRHLDLTLASDEGCPIRQLLMNTNHAKKTEIA